MCGKRTHEHDACGVGGNGRPGERRGVGGEVGGEHGAVGVGGEVSVQELEEEGDGEGGG